MEQQEKYQQLLRLTALWALVESGLGGMMHAFHLPFTGLVLGGFSILILSLIARGSQHVFGRVIKATLIVIAVKAAVNPFTSPMAYIAVGFQGLCAALLFSISINSRILFMVFGAITMMESAVQKLLVLTLIFGQTWWKALNAWTESVTQLFGVSTQSEGSTYIVGIYLGLFIIWGLILGNWMFYLPHQIREREQKYAHIIPEPSIEAPLKTGKKTTITAFILFIFLASGLWLSTEKGALSAFMLLVRTVVVVILWIYLILPVWQKFIQRWLIQQKEKHQEISLVLNIIPHLSRYVKPLYQSIAANHKGVGKWKEFILSLIVLSLNGEKE